MAQDPVEEFGSVYFRSGTTRGTSTSSGVFAFGTGFARRVVFGFAIEEGNGLRNSNADPAVSTGVGTFAYFRFISTNPSNPTQARFRAFRDQTLSAASAVTDSSRRQSLATSITGLRARYLLFGY